jgi:hypothetical protein
MSMITVGRRPCHFHGNRLYFEDGWEDKLREIGLVQGSDWRNLSPGTLVNTSPRVNMFRVVLGTGETVYFKRYVPRVKKSLSTLLIGKSGNEVFSYQQLSRIGVPTLKPLALGEMRRGWLKPPGCIVTLGIENAVSLDEFALKQWYDMPPLEKTRVYKEISQQIIHQLRLAHQHNFFHYDLKWRNILVQRDAAGSYHCTWIDCPRGRYMRLRRSRGRMVDLSSLARLSLSYLSRTQRLRFIYDYLGEGASRKQARKLFMRVNGHLSRRYPRIFDPGEHPALEEDS